MRKILVSSIATTLVGCSLLFGAAEPASAEAGKKIRYCTAGKDGNYAFTGIAISKQIPRQVDIVYTKGSRENIEMVKSGYCDVGIVQADAYAQASQADQSLELTVALGRVMYPEYAHFICHNSVGGLSDLEQGQAVLVEDNNSGSSVVWDSVVTANKDRYGKITPLPRGGQIGLNAVSLGNAEKCQLFVSGLGSAAMNEANLAIQTNQWDMHLAQFDDSKLLNLKDRRGRPYYERAEIPSSTYPGGLQRRSLWGSSVNTIKVNSVLIYNTSFQEHRPEDLDTFFRATTRAAGEINARVMPR